MSWVAAAVGIGTAAAGIIGSSKAAGAQRDAAAMSDATQRYIFDEQTKQQEPFRQAGVTGLNRLMYLLGLSTDGGMTQGGQTPLTYEQVRNQLLPKYTTTTQELGVVPFKTDEGMLALGEGSVDKKVIDEAALEAAIQQQLKQNDVINAQRFAAAQGDQNFGSLMRDFGMEDFEQDPGYAFRLSEGMKALDRSASARGALQSGAALKAAQRFGQDLASQEYQNAFNRYQINRSNKLNPLQSLAGMGQTSANTLTGAAGQMGQNISNSQMAAGNARASGYMGAANAVAGGLGQYLNYQQGQNYLNMLRQRPTGYVNSYVPGFGYGTSPGE